MNDEETMRKVRQELAVKIVLANPHAFDKAVSKTPDSVAYADEDEKAKVEALRGLMKLEPSIKHIIGYYLRHDKITVNGDYLIVE